MKLMGAGPDSLNEIARAYVRKHGLEKFYLHGLGHHVGLEVHDPADGDAPLAPGMVITVEPGVYLAEESIGVRIEDMILITPDGCEVLSRSLERETRDLENAIRRR
jgi:Xaa-Pro aminopeptidase